MPQPNLATVLDSQKCVAIENGTSLVLSFHGFEGIFKSVFVGAKTGEYLVTTPLSANLAQIGKITKGTAIEAKFIRQGKSFSFECRFIGRVLSPIDLILISFPKTVRDAEQRAQRRINCLLSGRVELLAAGRGMTIGGLVKDISKTGCRFQFNTTEVDEDSVRTGRKLRLRLNFPGIPGEQSAAGHFTTIKKAGTEATAGVQFTQRIWWVPPYE